jgi:hypothetical protein
LVEPFRELFGLDPAAVGETCVLIPFARKNILSGLGVGKFNRGLLYSAASGGLCTVILTRIGPVFAGDAVLALAETSCREVIFLGTCGLIPPGGGREIGSLVCPSLWYARESFTELVRGDDSSGVVISPDPKLRLSLLRAGGLEDEKGPTGISFGSLRLQEELLPVWRGRVVEVVDLESAAVLSAASRIGIRAVSLLAVSDIVGLRPYYQILSPEEERRLREALDRAVKSVCRYIQEKPVG